MRVIDQQLLQDLLQKAAASERGRVVWRLHEHHEPVQRMVNAILPGSYVTPHKHEDPDKVELVSALVGRIACLEFDAAGGVADIVVLDAQGPVAAVDIPPRTYHAMVALTPCAMLEIIQGPYDAATHKKFAPWAPLEGCPESAAYLQQLIEQIEHWHERPRP